MENKREKLIVALDLDGFSEAEKLIDLLLPVVKIFKVGSQLFTGSGPDIVRAINRRGAKVFLDLKFCDIPNTVARAVKSAADLGVFMLTIHTLGARQMLKGAMRSLSAFDRSKRPIILGITVLTSLDKDALREIGINRPLSEQVISLAAMAKEEGLDGVVCSGRETGLVRRQFKNDFLIVTPGIRPAESARDDQKRVITPSQAINKEGADYIVVGRPIIKAPDPLKAARLILREME
ncbi:MAG: orotidine-5'-phosphate decarboxylase [Candidatus Omnitrophota bacterium]|nr:orotidine-5'-phosphate decarboxylase [Candidatus Omnitrophota bacterium]